ncbi:MAG: deoxyribose-phosphate aldolase [Planctomycetaceae bacterium]|nr:deoxyribose-phosphate aldolase [Planctomycetaceae bacterium]
MKITTKEQFAKYFDHTLLDPMAAADDIRRVCNEALAYGFYAVCIHPRWVALAADILHGSGVKVVSVAGFPFGTNLIQSTAAEAKAVIMQGADEVDIVADLASIISGDAPYLKKQFMEVLKICRSMHPPVLLKIIIEAAALNPEQIQFVCQLAQGCGVDFLKTSTGFHKAGGARLEDVRLMAASAPHCRIKAAGGIKTLAATLAFIEAGATRIGASASVSIMQEFEKSGEH